MEKLDKQVFAALSKGDFALSCDQGMANAYANIVNIVRNSSLGKKQADTIVEELKMMRYFSIKKIHELT